MFSSLFRTDGKINAGPSRLTKPFIREGNKLRETSWEEALSLVGSAV
jgi:predicted molibdopterin-dependent oxidoreductase YjgC